MIYLVSSASLAVETLKISLDAPQEISSCPQLCALHRRELKIHSQLGPKVFQFVLTTFSLVLSSEIKKNGQMKQQDSPPSKKKKSLLFLDLWGL